jgi:hypothetical protein
MAFRSTDPDWVRSLPMRKHARVCVQPFDVRDIDIELTLPPHYPVAPLHAYVRGPAALPARLLDVCHEHIHSWITVRTVHPLLRKHLFRRLIINEPSRVTRTPV